MNQTLRELIKIIKYNDNIFLPIDYPVYDDNYIYFEPSSNYLYCKDIYKFLLDLDPELLVKLNNKVVQDFTIDNEDGISVLIFIL